MRVEDFGLKAGKMVQAGEGGSTKVTHRGGSGYVELSARNAGVM